MTSPAANIDRTEVVLKILNYILVGFQIPLVEYMGMVRRLLQDQVVMEAEGEEEDQVHLELSVVRGIDLETK